MSYGDAWARRGGRIVVGVIDPEPDDEERPKKPLVTQGPRSAEMPRRQVSIDDWLRSGRRGGGQRWEPIA